MRKHALKPVWKRKFTHTTDSRHGLPVFGNVLDRRFKADRPNWAWVSDITYIRTRSGWLYLAAVLDLHSTKLVGWAMTPNMPAELVCTALRLAICQRCPELGLIVHSDRGGQYASDGHRKLLEKYGLVGCMSRKGNCLDNSVMERFFLSLKMERVWQREYANHQGAINDIADYMVNFYNCKRLHSNLGPLVTQRLRTAVGNHATYLSVRKNLTTTMNMIRHQVAFYNLTTFLLCQLIKYCL